MTLIPPCTSALQSYRNLSCRSRFPNACGQRVRRPPLRERCVPISRLLALELVYKRIRAPHTLQRTRTHTRTGAYIREVFAFDLDHVVPRHGTTHYIICSAGPTAATEPIAAPNAVRELNCIDRDSSSIGLLHAVLSLSLALFFLFFLLLYSICVSYRGRGLASGCLYYTRGKKKIIDRCFAFCLFFLLRLI